MGRRASSLDAILAWWIGCDLPSPEHALRAAGWGPDPRSAYCQRCGESAGAGEARADGCAACRGRSTPLCAFVRLGVYGPPLREWLLLVKYHKRWTEMAELLGSELGHAVLAAGVVARERAAVVPMPMPWLRRAYRGIDHARVIASSVARTMRVPLRCALRKANAAPQVTLSAGRRVRSGAAGLRVGRPVGRWGLEGLDVVLVDDVRTTGASIQAAARVLARLRPGRIAGAVVAVADGPGRLRTAPQGRSGSGISPV